MEAWLPPTADRPPKKDLAQRVRVWVRRLRRPRVEPTTVTLLREEGENPSGPPSRSPPMMAWDEPQAAPLNQDPQEAEGEGRGARVREWLNRAKGTLSTVAALFRCGAEDSTDIKPIAELM